MPRKALQQGQADGMCGLYAVLNFLNRTPWEDTPSNGLRYLLEACRELGWLTPSYLIERFEDYQLKSIIDLQIERYRLNFETFFQSDVSKIPELKDLEYSNLLCKVVNKPGFAIIQRARGNPPKPHWIMVAGVNKEPKIFDSDDGSGDPIELKKVTLYSANHWGIFIVKKDRKFPEMKL